MRIRRSAPTSVSPSFILFFIFLLHLISLHYLYSLPPPPPPPTTPPPLLPLPP
ncbi:hypothetical protein SOVF_002850 [Spinacia oleracea]|nr:hypothetical protein SOVF_002850 [Spinacia oleracea]